MIEKALINDEMSVIFLLIIIDFEGYFNLEIRI